MDNFLSLGRALPGGAVNTKAVQLIERLVRVPQLNKIFANSHTSAVTLLTVLQQHCGEYVIERAMGQGGERPRVYFANHPLGGADIVAALKILGEQDTPFRIIANHVISPPSCLKKQVISVDPTGNDKALNRRSLAYLLRGFGQDYKNLFVFPSGICSRFDPFQMVVTDPTWYDTFLRIGLRANADFVPVWFGGRNSTLFYAFCLIAGRLGGIALPSEFFKQKQHPLLCKIGIPIPTKVVNVFGDQAMSGLRAAVYSLERENQPTTPRPLPAPNLHREKNSGTVRVQAYTADEVDRATVMRLRRNSFGEDNWSECDAAATHLLAFGPEECVGYYRILNWNQLGADDRRRISPAHAVFDIKWDVPHELRIFEFGRFCISQRANGIGVARSLWRGLRDYVTADSGPAVALGIISLDNHNPIAASAMFSVARQLSTCRLTNRFVAKVPIILKSPHYTLRPDQINPTVEPNIDGLPSIVRTYLSLGARFGPSARWTDFGCRPSVLTSITPQELRLGK